MTPVAQVKPVFLAGAMVERASLYNVSNIQNLGIDKGCKCLITRSGDVIPAITSITESTGTIFPTPTKCPSCSGPVEFEGEYLICPDLNCPARLVGNLQNWINEIQILEWGSTLLERIIENKSVSDVAGLYDLTVDQLSNVERMGKKSATKCISLLHAQKEMSLDIFLGGLSLTGIGGSSIRAIMATGKTTLAEIQAMTLAEFEAVPGLGPVKSQNLFSGLQVKAGLIQRLLDRGIKIKVPTVGKLTNASLAFTGSMNTKRAVLEKMVTDNGGVVKSSVGKGLSFLVIDDVGSSSSKAVAARKFGTKLISENEFLEMVK